MPNPDIREKNADPNDPENLHTSRAVGGAETPPRTGGAGVIVAIVAVVAVIALVYFAFFARTNDTATVNNDVQVEQPAEAPASSAPTAEAPAASESDDASAETGGDANTNESTGGDTNTESGTSGDTERPQENQ